MSNLRLRSDISYGLYDLETETPLLAVDLLYARKFVAFEDDAARVLGKLLSGKSVDELLNEIRSSSKENGDLYVKQTESFFKSVLPLIFEGFDGGDLAISQESAPPNDGSFELKIRNAHHLYTAVCELTNRCQLNCVHCYNSDHFGNKEMDTQHWLNTIMQLRKKGVYRITLTGGDPFVRDDIWTIIEHIRSLHMSFDVFTNGQFLAVRENAERLRDFCPHSVQCSVYGVSPETHDSVTQVKGSFERTVQCLRYFQDFNVPTALKTSILTLNEEEIIRIGDLARSLGATHQVDFNIVPKMSGDFSNKNLRICKENMVNLLLQKELPLYKGMEKMVLGKDRSGRTEDDILCSAGRNGICILRDGSVTPCIVFPLVLGRVTESSIDDILDGERMKAWLNARWSERKGKCVDCQDSAYCAFCPGNSFVEKGDYFTDNSCDCEITEARREALRVLNC